MTSPAFLNVDLSTPDRRKFLPITNSAAILVESSRPRRARATIPSIPQLWLSSTAWLSGYLPPILTFLHVSDDPHQVAKAVMITTVQISAIVLIFRPLENIAPLPGLAAAHEKGILHRDLKPANIMLDEREKVRVTDFGLVAVAGDPQANITDGTPAYMAPEQLAGREVTVRSDIYTLGLVLYEIFTGKRGHCIAIECSQCGDSELNETSACFS